MPKRKFGLLKTDKYARGTKGMGLCLTQPAANDLALQANGFITLNLLLAWMLSLMILDGTRGSIHLTQPAANDSVPAGQEWAHHIESAPESALCATTH